MLNTQKEFKIKITGQGTREDIAKELRLVAHQINQITDDEVNGEKEWEYSAIMVELSDVDDDDSHN